MMNGVLVNINVEVCFIHNLFSNQLLNYILQGDYPDQLGLEGVWLGAESVAIVTPTSEVPSPSSLYTR